MSNNIKGEVVVITGASSGLGEASVPSGWNARAVDGAPAPVDGLRRVQPGEQHAVQPPTTPRLRLSSHASQVDPPGAYAVL